MDALADNGAGSNGAVQVEQLNPIIVGDAGLLRVRLGEPNDRSAARQGQHQEVVGVSRVDAPFLVRRDEVEDDLFLAIAVLAQHLRDAARVDRRAIDGKALAEVTEPAMVLVKLLASGERPPGYKLIHIGITCRVADMLALDP